MAFLNHGGRVSPLALITYDKTRRGRLLPVAVPWR